MGNSVSSSSSSSNSCVDMAASCGADPYEYPVLEGDEKELPRELIFSLKFLNNEQIELCRRLCDMGQGHLFEGWNKIPPENRQTFCQQLQKLDKALPRGQAEPSDSFDSMVSYAGGLASYIEKIRTLLYEHRAGLEQWKGWTASAPSGMLLRFDDEDFDTAEQLGRRFMGKTGFILNAWEKGSDALLTMPLELVSCSSYLQSYIEHILAIQQRYGAGRTLPFCILTSPNTHDKIQHFLKDNNNFGMDPSQLHILVPDLGIPAVVSYNGNIFMDPTNSSELYTLPEGDGCFHALIHNAGITKEWIKIGIQYVYFFEGANSLAMQALPYMLYATKIDKLVLNYLAVPRKAKEHTDAIVSLSKLSAQDGSLSTITIVDHKKLDHFLECRQSSDMDETDDNTNGSPFPAATNTMLMTLDVYHKTLQRTGGELPGSLTPNPLPVGKQFLEPVRATSRLTDISQCLNPEETERIGVTCMEAGFCHAPAKLPPQIDCQNMVHCSIATAEVALYDFHKRVLRRLGCSVVDGEEESIHNSKLRFNPNIVIHPSFCLTVSDYIDKFRSPENVNISKRSTLFVKGCGARISSLALDGCMIVNCEKGFTLNVEGQVWNLGWKIVSTDASQSDLRKGTRGYSILRLEQKTVHAGEKPGNCAII